MEDRKVITNLYYVTDSGDIDGGLFDEEWLEKYIKTHGTGELIEKLASMQMQVLLMKNKINIAEIKSNEYKHAQRLINIFGEDGVIEVIKKCRNNPSLININNEDLFEKVEKILEDGKR